MKRTSILLAGAAAVVLAASALAAAYWYIPGGTRPAFDEGELHVCLNDGGTIELDWPEARAGVQASLPAENSEEEDAAPDVPAEGTPVSYAVDIKSGDQHIQKLQSTPGLLLDGVTTPMTVKIQAVMEAKNLLGLSRQVHGEPLEAEVGPASLNAPEAVALPGPGSLSLSWKLAGSAPDLYEVFALDEGGVSRHAASTSSKQLELKVGRDGDLPLPGYGHPLEVQVRAGVRGEGYVLCGPASNRISVERQDLLGDDLNLTCQEAEPLHYTLEWDETRGEYYELREWNGEDWTLLDTLEPAERFTYQLGRSTSGAHHRYQVTARDRNGTERSCEEVDFFASISPLYATVWPIIDQQFYEEASQSGKALGKIPGGTTLCVLDEQGDWFQVRYKDQYGWVDSRFCMINLPEYVGGHCEYDITNSYQSVFKVHDSPIALITDQVISGFEHVQEADGNFLVPYLYPCSKKLLAAARQAEADGYRLKIYEAFRPNEATRALYDTTASQLNWAALVYDGSGNAVDPVTGWTADLADGLLRDPETGEKVSRETLAQREAEARAAEEAARAAEEAARAAEAAAKAPVPEEAPPEEIVYPPDLSLAPTGTPPVPAEETPDPSEAFFTLPEEGEGGSLKTEEPPASSETPPQDTGEPEEEPEPEPEYDTYFKIMTNNGRFNLGNFLARVTSAHNRGIALDLTLEKINTGEELEMQSAIHDLSWYSATYLNNDNAKLLEKYMTGAGMRGLTSEWWHFQDDETRESINLSGYLFKGVDMGGWTKDERGWRYRDADGSVFKDTTVTADGVRYRLDRDGYVIE